ncbi:Gfo/Idh/MocA family oxidoreductase [Desmospora activa]|uniref:Gfo/Idh/MocA family oxidoreductase n=1 Tax=Desmospora activa TaxID=500615 RepID=UPI002481C46E|nr:Gfo/Idh/MocA family oxidoreductase [Desmospora activa]
MFFLERYHDAFQAEMRAFIQSITDNQEVLANGNDGLQAELIAHAANRSLKEGRPVKISEVQSVKSTV